MHERVNEIDPTAPVTEQASAWWVLLNEGEPTAADHRAFGEWLARSPERVEAYLQAVSLGAALRSPDLRWGRAPVEALILAARSSPDVSTLPISPDSIGRAEATSLRAPCHPRVSAAAGIRVAVGALLASAFVATGLYFDLKPLRLETVAGEQRSVTLADGSLVMLNTSTSVEVRMDKDHRAVNLRAGEALFKVAHDPTRPFDVNVGDTTLRALGTEFDVDHRNTSTTVTVVDGRVAVFLGKEDSNDNKNATNKALEAGEQLTLAPHETLHRVRANVATTVAWTERKLVFDHRPLGEVAAEFNRYNHQTIEIESVELRKQEVTGVFQADDTASFLVFLSRIPGVTVRPSADHSRLIVSDEAQGTTP